MSTGLIKGAPYPSPTYGTGGNQNQSVPKEGKAQAYGTSGAGPRLPVTVPLSESLIAKNPYPPTPYGVNADTTGPLMALRTPLLEGPPYPRPSYEATGATGTPGNLRKALISGDPYPTTPYGAGAQTNNSEPTAVVATFQVNLQTLHYWNWELPNRTYLEGNETSTEAANQDITRSTWLPSLFNGVENYVLYDPAYAPNGKNLFVDSQNPSQFTAYGAKAVYLYNTYCNASDPNAVLTLVSSTGLFPGSQQ